MLILKLLFCFQPSDFYTHVKDVFKILNNTSTDTHLLLIRSVLKHEKDFT